mgnify:FL=1
MLITPKNITHVIIMAVCVFGMAFFVFLWAVEDRSAGETSYFFGLIAAFAFGAISPFKAGAWIGRMIIAFSLFGPTILILVFHTGPVSHFDLWPAFVVGGLMANSHYIENTIRFVMDMQRKFAR